MAAQLVYVALISLCFHGGIGMPSACVDRPSCVNDAALLMQAYAPSSSLQQLEGSAGDDPTPQEQRQPDGWRTGLLKKLHGIHDSWYHSRPKKQAAHRPVVLGTVQIEKMELEGHLPILVDAFYNVEKTSATVIFNLAQTLHQEKVRTQDGDAFKVVTKVTHPGGGGPGDWDKWSCMWSNTDDNASAAASLSSVRNSETLSAATNGEVTDGTWLSLDADDDPLNAKVQKMEKHMHWSIVVSCPLPQGTELSTARLELQATSGGAVSYRRSNIAVETASFVADAVDYMLCTMVSKDQSSGSDHLDPWVRYHIALGFEQVLVYVEEADVAWVKDALGQFITNGKVVLVPFYFGALSAKKEFLMQGAMENHCLHQAKGRAKWVGHLDVDEYFDIRATDTGKQTLSSILSGLGDNVAFLSGRSQFWGSNASTPNDGVPFPCGITCRGEGYLTGGVRSKIIMRPQYISALFPHEAHVVSGYQRQVADPDVVLRVNHYRACDVRGHGCSVLSDGDWWFTGMEHKQHGCHEDNSFQETCTALVRNE